MYKHEMDLVSIVEDTKRTRFHPQMAGQKDGQMGRQGETSINPFQLRWSKGYDKA